MEKRVFNFSAGPAMLPLEVLQASAQAMLDYKGKGYGIAEISHRGETIFRGIPGPFRATRYHSLVVERASLPQVLQITAETDGLIMALSHKTLPIHGVQFHPESIASENGRTIMKNFLDLALSWNEQARVGAA